MVVNEITSSVQKSSAKSILMGAIIALTRANVHNF